jgi:hypothetical protein
MLFHLGRYSNTAFVKFLFDVIALEPNTWHTNFLYLLVFEDFCNAVVMFLGIEFWSVKG